MPGEAISAPRKPLALLFEELVDAAGCNLIPAPALAPDPPSIIDAFGALRAASAQYEVAPGIGLADHFWTHGADFHSGEVAARLTATARAGNAVQGFLVLHATEVRWPLLYGLKMAPIRVRNALEIDPGVDGPFLALIVCEVAPDGRAEAIEGYAMPIYHARRFVPVRCDLDRDVLRALEQLQVVLDAHGVEGTIQRIRPVPGTVETRLALTLRSEDGAAQDIHLAVDPVASFPPRIATGGQTDYFVTSENWADGSFVGWLEHAVISTVRDGGADHGKGSCALGQAGR